VFTGLVQALGRVASVHQTPVSRRVVVDVGAWVHRPEAGASIAVNGCCLTVVETAGPLWAFDVIPQTISVTNLGALAAGDPVNLEHAATLSTLLGGHVVLGHVDGLAEVVEVRTDGEWRVRVRLPGDLGAYAVDKGSIALDGVSLTVARVEDTASGTVVDVCLIPETLARTNLGARRTGDRLHVEADHLAKLVRRQLDWFTRRG